MVQAQNIIVIVKRNQNSPDRLLSNKIFSISTDKFFITEKLKAFKYNFSCWFNYIIDGK